MNEDGIKVDLQSRRIELRGSIGSDDDPVTPEKLESGLLRLGPGSVSLVIESPGGFAESTREMLRILESHDGQINTASHEKICSAGVDLFLSGVRRELGAEAMVMIHGTSCGFYGNTATMQEKLLELFRADAKRVNEYSEKLTVDVATISRWMSDGQDHYFNAEQALELGIATHIEVPRSKSLADIGYRLAVVRYDNDARRIRNAELDRMKRPVPARINYFSEEIQEFISRKKVYAYST